MCSSVEHRRASETQGKRASTAKAQSDSKVDSKEDETPVTETAVAESEATGASDPEADVSAASGMLVSDRPCAPASVSASLLLCLSASLSLCFSAPILCLCEHV